MIIVGRTAFNEDHVIGAHWCTWEGKESLIIDFVKGASLELFGKAARVYWDRLTSKSETIVSEKGDVAWR